MGNKTRYCLKLFLAVLVLSLFTPDLRRATDHSLQPPAYAKSKEHSSAGDKGHGGGHAKEGAHGSGHGAHHAPPLSYFIHWAVLLCAFFMVFKYLKNKQKAKKEAASSHHGAVHEEEQAHGGHDDEEEGGHHGIHVVKEAVKLSAWLCAMVVFLFFIEYAPALHAYHESVPVSLFKFAVKFTLGIGLTTFGILGMDEH